MTLIKLAYIVDKTTGKTSLVHLVEVNIYIIQYLDLQGVLFTTTRHIKKAVDMLHSFNGLTKLLGSTKIQEFCLVLFFMKIIIDFFLLMSILKLPLPQNVELMGLIYHHFDLIIVFSPS